MSSKIMSANRLDTGTVVYLARGNNWTANIEQALVVSTEPDRESCQRGLTLSGRLAEVVGAEWIDVKPVESAIVPTRLRELIRLGGPTVDYGKTGRTQA